LGRTIAVALLLFVVVSMGLLIGLAVLSVVMSVVLPIVGPVVGGEFGHYTAGLAWRHTRVDVLIDGALILAGMLGVLLVFLIPLALIVWRWLRGGSGERKQREIDEARMLKDIYHGLSRMEQRVESLEEILMDRTQSPKTDRKERS